MAVFETKYSIGDTVYHAGATTERRQHPCPDCKGEKKWTAHSPAASQYTFACPRCTASYSSHTDLSLTYSAHVPLVSKRTIGSVQYNTADGWDKGARYMCTETGVGSGNVYEEASLFPTYEEALEVATVKAKLADKSLDWCAKLYDKTLSISDYQLEHAMMREAKEFRSEIGSLFWNVSDLFDTIEAAEDKDAILEAVDDYKRWAWARDKEKFAAQGIEVGTDETRSGSAEGESAVAESHAPNPISDTPNA